MAIIYDAKVLSPLNRMSVWFTLIFLCSLVFSAISLADPSPPGSEPGAESSRFQTGVDREKQALEKKKVTAPIEMEEEEEKPAVPEGPAFTLKEVKITGATIFTAEELKSIYGSYMDKSITFRDLQDIADKIKAMYKKDGYLTTLTYVPEQQVSEGKVEIVVVEGRLGEVKVEGNGWFSRSVIEKQIHTKKNEVLNVFTLQRDLLRLNQNSDLEVKTVISAGKEPGTTDIVLQVKDKFPYHAGSSVDNQGTRLVGKYRDGISFRSSNLSGLCDSLFVTTIMSATSSGTSMSYVLPVDTRGIKIGFDATVFTMKLGQEYKAADITGVTQVYKPHISGEIYLSEDFQATINSGLEIKSNQKMIQHEKDTEDQLRIPYVDFSFSKMDSLLGGGQTSFSPRVSFGTAEFLGASSRNHPSQTRTGTGGSYFKYEQGLSRVQKMPFESYLSVRTQFQAASNSLPSSEQFQLGGANSVRGYPEGEYVCDFGGTLNVDWVFPTYIIPKDWVLPGAETPLRQQLQPIIFMDLGGGKVLKVGPGERKDRFLMSIGGGLKYQYSRNLFLRLEWAQRLGDRMTPGQGPSNFHMSFQFEI